MLKAAIESRGDVVCRLYRVITVAVPSSMCVKLLMVHVNSHFNTCRLFCSSTLSIAADIHWMLD